MKFSNEQIKKAKQAKTAEELFEMAKIENITMTIEEFETASDSPELIFEKYCEDVLKDTPSGHQKDLFAKALLQFEKEVSES